MWSWLFFGLQRIDLALIDIVALLLLVLVTTVLFWKRDRLAGMLMVPYVLWLGFATALNLAIWQLNA
jgi:tryptophan-rich sensory protein